MMTRSELFLNTLNDLEQRLSSETPYEILGASALLRKLLLDATSLVDQVNKKYKLKIQFEIVPPRQYPPGFPVPVFSTVQDGLDPDTSLFGHTRKKISRDEFLKTNVLTVSGREYSIREVILFEAHVMGGVHAGMPQGAVEQVLTQISQLFQVGGYDVSLRQLKAIGRVVIKALQPLKDKAK